MKLLLTPAAENDLSQIWDYCATQWSVAQAEHYLDGFKLAFETITSNPLIGKDAHNIKPGYRYLVQGSHIIFYKLSKTNLVIVRILHQRMLPQTRL